MKNKLCGTSYFIGWLEYGFAETNNLLPHEAEKYLTECRKINYIPSEEIAWYIKTEFPLIYANHLEQIKETKND